MPHMDMSGVETSGMEYADHEVQVISAVLTTDDGLPSGDDSQQAETFVNFKPVSDRGIDSDEVAELVGFYRKASLEIGNTVSQSEPNSAFGELSLGINISGESEEITSLSANAPTAERENIGDFLNRYASINEPGTLDAVSIGGSAPYEETDAGGGGQQDVSERQFSFRHQLGSGPYMDRTDDLTLFRELEVNDSIAQCTLEVAYILYWDTMELPEGRSSFARP